MNNIRLLREKNNLTQQDLANLFGVGRTTISMWEAGESMPRADKLPLLAKLLNCSVNDIFKEAQ